MRKNRAAAMIAATVLAGATFFGMAPAAADVPPVSGVLARCAVVLSGAAIAGGAFVAVSSVSGGSCIGTGGYCWYRDGTVSADTMTLAMSDRYPIKGADVGHRISVVPSGSSCPEFVTVTAPATSDVVSTAPFPLADLTVSGSVEPGQTVTAKLSTPFTLEPGLSYSYRWYADGALVANTGKNWAYRVATGLVGMHLSAVLQVDAAGYLPSDTVSSAVLVVGRTQKSGTVRLSGTVAVGKRLTAKPHQWSRNATLRYRWFEGSKLVATTKSRSWRVPKSARHHRIYVEIVATRSGYAPATVRSTASSTVR